MYTEGQRSRCRSPLYIYLPFYLPLLHIYANLHMAPNELARHEVCCLFQSFIPAWYTPPHSRPVILYTRTSLFRHLFGSFIICLFRHAAKYPYRGRQLSAYNIPVMLTSTTFSTDVSDLGFKVIGTFPNWPIFFPCWLLHPVFAHLPRSIVLKAALHNRHQQAWV